MDFHLVLNQERPVFVDSTVNATVLLILTETYKIQTVDAQVCGEIATRILHSPGERKVLSSEKNFFLSAMTSLYCSEARKTRKLPPGEYRYDFQFSIPSDAPVTVQGPNLKKRRNPLPIFEVNYWLEFTVSYSTSFKGKKRTDKIRKKRFYFPVSDWPETYLRAKWVGAPCNKGIVASIGKDPSGLGQGFIAILIHIGKVCVVAGQSLPFEIQIDNDSKLTISKIRISLFSSFEYHVHDLKVHCEDKVFQKTVTQKILPNSKDRIETSLEVAEGFHLCPTTPDSEVGRRRVEISYRFGIKLMTKGIIFDSEVSTYNLPIVISNIPIL